MKNTLFLRSLHLDEYHVNPQEVDRDATTYPSEVLRQLLRCCQEHVTGSNIEITAKHFAAPFFCLNGVVLYTCFLLKPTIE